MRRSGRALTGLVVSVGAILGVGLVAGCSSSASKPAARGSTDAFLARAPQRVDYLEWQPGAHGYTGALQTTRVVTGTPPHEQYETVLFQATLTKGSVTITPLHGKTGWHGTLRGSRLVLTWTSDGDRLTTTFVRARIADLDAAQQALAAQIAPGYPSSADAQAAAEAARVAAQQAAAASRLAAQRAGAADRAAAQQAAAAARAARQEAAAARAAAARASAAKAAEVRAAHPKAHAF